MPRGGGGGFRGGGFGGGGFRGGGFRGGSRSFRVGSVRSSGRPFGRTGARRTISRSPSRSSSGRSTFWRRPHRSYWGPYYRPWYRRWWYWNWWWGYPGRPWYYAPVYWGGGIALAIIILLLIIPIIGLAIIPYPFTNASSGGLVTYRDTQTLYYNEYWYERETMQVGGSITYSMPDAFSPSHEGVMFIIADHPFEAFPTTSQRTGTYSEDSMIVQADHDYQYLGYFLKPGSILDYSFEVVSGEIEFFITDANDLNRWNNWETITPKQEYTGSGNYSDIFTVQYAQDWYLVWYNPNPTPAEIDFTVDYTAEDVYDFSSAPVNIGPTETVPESTYVVPTGGTWYFFIYFDPFVNPDYSVEITFDVSFETGVTSTDRWADVRPILLVIGAIVAIVLIIALIQRRSRKSQPPDAVTTPPVAPSTTTPAEVVTTTSAGQCQRCKYEYKAGDIYCKNCGAKLIGRDYGSSNVTTPSTSDSCKSCGQALKPGSKYCKHCGAKVVTEEGYSYFPDERKSFYCQLDGSKHPSTDSAYQCTQCSRMICKNCYEDLGRTEVSVCPYCKGSLHQIQ